MDASTSPDVDILQTDPASLDLKDSQDVADQTSPINDDAEDQPQRSATGPMQKRRRVTRACDECRRKKIKCDGKQPCTHCTVYSYECTYDQPSNRRRTAAPQYIEALETQLKRAKGILSLIIPTLDLNDASIDAHLQSGILPQLPPGVSRQPQIPRVAQRRDDGAKAEVADSRLESMVQATGQLDLDEDGKWDYHGHSSGLSFMRRIQQDFGHIIGDKAHSSPLFTKHRSQMFDSPSSNHLSPAESTGVNPPGTDLPSKKEARRLCDKALIDAGALLRVVHLPSFYKSVDRLYETSPENYTNTENSFLPLLYAVLALGTLFSKNDSETDQSHYEAMIEEGYKYFRASRQLLDIADCRDLVSLQAIVFMIQFLQSSAKLSTCYSYIGVALRSALRMGLHRSFNINFTPIEAETRKRLFWVIWRMDTYVGAMLGLPLFLDDEDVDQDYPSEVDDECITETEILPMPKGAISVMAAANAHAKIIQVLAKVCKYVYPTKGTQSGGKYSVTYSVSYSKIREIEQDMQSWLEELPMALKPGGEAPPIIIRVQQLLRMAFAHAQLLLYRPFLHYVSQSNRDKSSVDQRAFACASACVSVSRNIIHIMAEMKRKDLLIGAYWFSMYTTFFAVMTLLYFVLEHPDSTTSHELFKDALEGKQLLDDFAKRSLAADRCSATLKAIFDKLPESITQPSENVESKKRRQESLPQSMQIRPHLFKHDSDFVATSPRRAQTFPESTAATKRTALPLSQAHLANLGVDPAYNSPSQSSSDLFETTPSLTPTSVTASSLSSYGMAAGPQRPSQQFSGTPLSHNYTEHSALSVPLSDINTMMFPTADPMQYPNQAMTTFEDTHPQAYIYKHGSTNLTQLPYHPASGVNIKPSPAPYSAMGNVPIGPRRADSEVQLLGPMPMYLMQGAQQRGFHPSPGLHSTPIPNQEGGNMSFDELFSEEEWAQTFMDQGLGLGGNANAAASGVSYPRHPPYGPGGPAMGGWQ